MRRPTILVLFFFLIFFFPGKAQDDDSCIVSMKIFSYKNIDSTNYLIEKRPVPNIIRHIKACSSKYEYGEEYNDKGFIMKIPSYLKQRYYTFGGGLFCINFYDTTSEDQSTVRAVVIYYDFDSSYKLSLFKEVAEGRRRELVDQVSGRKIYPFISYDEKYAADILLDNNMIVSYYTKEKQFEEELKKSILSFKTKESP